MRDPTPLPRCEPAGDGAAERHRESSAESIAEQFSPFEPGEKSCVWFFLRYPLCLRRLAHGAGPTEQARSQETTHRDPVLWGITALWQPKHAAPGLGNILSLGPWEASRQQRLVGGSEPKGFSTSHGSQRGWTKGQKDVPFAGDRLMVFVTL